MIGVGSLVLIFKHPLKCVSKFLRKYNCKMGFVHKSKPIFSVLLLIESFNPLRVITSHETPNLFSRASVSSHRSKRENPSLTSRKISMSELWLVLSRVCESKDKPFSMDKACLLDKTTRYVLYCKHSLLIKMFS